MSDAPERVWVWLDLDTLESSVSTAEAEGMTEYIRADIHIADREAAASFAYDAAKVTGVKVGTVTTSVHGRVICSSGKIPHGTYAIVRVEDTTDE